MSDHPEPMTHAWTIGPREYRRHEARRGRRHAFERLIPARTALVVIDMVPFFVAESRYARGGIPKIVQLAGALRLRGGTVAWVLPSSEGAPSAVEEFFGPDVARAYRASGGSGPPAERLWPAFDVHADDVMAEMSAQRVLPRALPAARGADGAWDRHGPDHRDGGERLLRVLGP